MEQSPACLSQRATFTVILLVLSFIVFVSNDVPAPYQRRPSLREGPKMLKEFEHVSAQKCVHIKPCTTNHLCQRELKDTIDFEQVLYVDVNVGNCTIVRHDAVGVYLSRMCIRIQGR